MGIFDWFANRVANSIADRLVGDDGKVVVRARQYRQGVQDLMLKTHHNQFDDNIIINFVSLIANRITSQTIGGGFTLDFDGDTETDQEKWIKACLDANKKEVLFHRAVLSAVESGTGYLFLGGGSVIGRDGVEYPRITLIDPAFVAMDSLPEDFESIIRYTIKYKFVGANGKIFVRKREIELDDSGSAWTITDYISTDGFGSRWEQTGQETWPFPFAPIIHWQNAPSIDRAEGEPDINTGMVQVQNRINFIAANLSKIIRLFAHPQRIFRNVSGLDKIDIGADQAIKINGGPDTDIKQLEQLSDLTGSMEYLRMLRQAMFDIARVVDIDSLEDKLGAMTNFALRVLYQDNINMIATKRELLGDMLEELVQRLLVIGGKADIGVKVIWPDFIPENDAELTQAYSADLNMGIVSHQTIAGLRGYDWKKEQDRILEEDNAAYETTPAE